MTVLCIDCEHFADRDRSCTHSAAVDLVDGEVGKPAHEMRKPNAPCGPTGALFSKHKIPYIGPPDPNTDPPDAA